MLIAVRAIDEYKRSCKPYVAVEACQYHKGVLQTIDQCT